MGFLFLHLVLLFPLVMIWITIKEKTSDLRIKEKSIILAEFLNILIFLAVFAAIYVAIPIALAMMYNGTTDLTEAFNRIENL
jgi:hypothetical protein